MRVGQADNDICAKLKAAGRLVEKSVYQHSYPFCWRSDTPLIYKAVPSWFVGVQSVKDRLLANNEATYWVPSFVKDGRFHNWLVDAKDWAISRNRYPSSPFSLPLSVPPPLPLILTAPFSLFLPGSGARPSRCG